MGLKIKLSIVIFTSLLFSELSFAGWTGPSEVLSGTWGNNPGQFAIQYGDTSDTFPTTIDISPSGKIAITEDQTLDRVQIFNSTGQLANIINTFAFTIAFDTNENLYVSGGGFRKYDSSGKVVWSKTGTSYDALYALSSGDIIGYDKDNKNYALFSPTGQLIKTSAERPLELGRVSEYPLGNRKYKTTVKYEDATYTIISEREYERFVRDNKKNLYAMNPGIVEKFSPCGKLIGRLDMPEKKAFAGDKIPGEEQYVFIHDEYGAPVVDVNGNIYAWKKSPTKYSILKWTWQDDPNTPSGPDAPTGLTVMPSTTGLYLTWQASPQDPGCVTGYEIARATSSGGIYSTVTTVEKGVLKYNDTTASAGTTYYYKVRAKAGSEYSPYTSEVSGKR